MGAITLFPGSGGDETLRGGETLPDLLEVAGGGEGSEAEG